MRLALSNPPTGTVMPAKGPNTPKNHHFVAQMHAARFTDDTGKLWAFNKEGGALFYAPPKAVFAKTHLYRIEDADGQKDTSLEAEFSTLEGDASAIITKLIDGARTGKASHLTEQERATWDMYFYLQWKRTPDVHAKVASLNEAETRLDSIFAEIATRGPEAAAEVAKLDTPKERKRLIQGGKVHAIRRAPGDVLQVLASRGLVLLHVSAPDQSLAIGSLPIVRKAGDLRAEDSEVWLPIASDVAAGPGYAPGTITIVELTNAEEVWRLNLVTASQSSTFAAASKILMESLIAALDQP